MSSLLRPRNNVSYFFIVLFLFIICSFIVSGFKLSVSPSELNIDADENEEVCNTFVISYSNESTKIKVYDFWNNNTDNVMNISNYIFNSEKLAINTRYSSSVTLKNRDSFNFCITGRDSGLYEGALFFESVDYGLSIGVFIHLNVVGNSNSLEKDDLVNKNSLTGFSTYDSFGGYSRGILIALIFTFACLIALLFFLAELAKKRREKIY